MAEKIGTLVTQNKHEFPVVPLIDMVVFPGTVVPLFVKRPRSIQALEEASTDDTEDKHELLLVAQKDPNETTPGPESLYSVGTLATILQLLKLPDGTIKVLVEGTHRCNIDKISEEKSGYLTATVLPIETEGAAILDQNLEALLRTVISQFEKYIKLNKKIPLEILSTLTDLEDPNRISDMIAVHITLKTKEKQEILELCDLKSRLEKLLILLENEIDLLRMQKRLRSRLKEQVAKDQRAYYLNEQIKAIQKELDVSQGVSTEQDQLEERINKAKMPPEAKKKALSELNKFKAMSAMSSEAAVSRNYLEALLSVPWSQRTKVNYDLKQAEKVMKQAHYGLDQVRKRMLEFLAVYKRVRRSKGLILCLVGPPGVGKTSLGKAIAEAIGCKFVRVSLGGVRDEAEIRGHRRTYIGAMPGQIMQKLTKVGVKNPLFMLDEIDKMAMDFRGDPASALLEVLDPEQNSAFNDHYLEVDYDLSEVLFIATANTLNIPSPLLDRMEIIRVPGYTEGEKIHIAQNHLLPKQKELHGLKLDELAISKSTLTPIIRHYTREAGVRDLERVLAKLCRKAVMALSQKSPSKKLATEQSPSSKKNKENIASAATYKIIVTPRSLEKYLGIKRFRYGIAKQEDQIGQVTGLAWTEVGGELLTIEAALLPGKGKISYTGQLGEVMQESIQAAFSVVKSRGGYLGIKPDTYEKSDIHVHVPEGATPKDGPSAGIGMCTALVSILTNSPIRADVAMTGEITLRGEVLAIGGLKEKLLAAHRGAIRTVIIPEENKSELKEIPKNITQGLMIHPVRWIDQVFDIAFRIPLKSLDNQTNTLKSVPLLNVTLSSNQKPDANERAEGGDRRAD